MNAAKKMIDPGEKTCSKNRYNRDVFFKKNAGRLSKICAHENAASGKNWQRGTVAKKGEKMTLTFVVKSTVHHKTLINLTLIATSSAK